MRFLKKYESFIETDIHTDDFNFSDLKDNDVNKVKLFISNLKEDCKKNNIELVLKNSQGIPYTTGGENPMMVNGYFDDKPPKLACAVGKDISQWLLVLIHESSHMDQFIEKVPEWTNNIGLDETDRWIHGKEGDMELIHREIKTGIDVELDCEKRSVEKIKKLGLDSIINIDDYIRKANAYILFYLWMEKNRRWYEIGKEPYNIDNIVNSMPNSFDIDYTVLTPDIEKLFDNNLN